MCGAAAQFKHYPGTYHGFAIRGDKRGKDVRDASIRESQAEVRIAVLSETRTTQDESLTCPWCYDVSKDGFAASTA